MKAQFKNSRKPIVEVAIVGIVLAAWFWMLRGTAPECSLLDKVAWVALEVLQPLVATAWRTVVSYFREDSGFAGHALQIAVSLRPLLCLTGVLI